MALAVMDALSSATCGIVPRNALELDVLWNVYRRRYFHRVRLKIAMFPDETSHCADLK